VSEALRLAAELLDLADQQRSGCEHDGCLLLDGVIRDCAWKIRRAAQHWSLDADEPATSEGGR